MSDFTSTNHDPNIDSTLGQHGLDFQRFFRVLRQFKWSIFGFACLFVVLGGLVAFSLTPQYKASVSLLADPSASKAGTEGAFVSTAMIWLFYETQKEILVSRNLALKVVDKLDLVNVFKDRADEKVAEPSVFSSIIDIGLDWRLWLPEEWRGQDEKSEAREPDLRIRAADRIIGALSVKVQKNSQILFISFKDEDPVLATDIINAFAESYVEFGLASRMETAAQQTAWLNEQVGDLRAAVQLAEQKLYDYQKAEGLIDSESRRNIVTTELASLSGELIRAQAARSEAEIRYRQVRRIKKSGSGYDSIAAVLNSNLIARLREDQVELSRKVSELSERYGKKHPKLLAAKTDLAEAESGLKRAVSKVVGSLKQEYDIASAQERKLKSLIKARKQDVQNIQGKALSQTKLERELVSAQELYDNYMAKFQEMDVSGDYDVSNVSIIDRAAIPELPYSPKKLQILIISLALGGLFGVVVALMRDRADSRFTLLEQLETTLGVTGLGMVPTIRVRRNDPPVERWTEHNPTSPLGESINHVRTGILFSDIDNPPKVIMVTSALPGEGKTTLSNNLAQSLAQLGKTVLIECDLRKPRAKGIYQLEGKCGLTDLVKQLDSAAECVSQPDAANNLFVIPAGTKLPNPLEFLSSDAFSSLIKALGEKFDYVVLDAPPVLAVSDAIVLGHQADGVVLAVRAGHTTERAAFDALRRLKAASIVPFGVVLTQADVKRMAYYGSYHYSDYSYYGDSSS